MGGGAREGGGSGRPLLKMEPVVPGLMGWEGGGWHPPPPPIQFWVL